MTTNWITSLALCVSVAICAVLILGAQYFVFMPMLDDAKASNQLSAPATTLSLFQEYLPTDKNLQLCNEIADGRSLPAETTCIVAPSEVIQTFSAIKVWSYSDQLWLNPPNYTEAGERTLIDPTEYQANLPGPVIISCPWGCTLGYP